MKELIKALGKNKFLLNMDLLGLKVAQLWVGRSDGPADDDDGRVQREREEDRAKNFIYGIEAVNLEESADYPGWYEIDTSRWPAGTYRFMLHSHSSIQAPKGTILKNMRDGQYSWPDISYEILINLSDEQKKFLYLEKNKRGFCFRIKIVDNRNIEPDGDGPEWIGRWPDIKKEITSHIEEKVNN